MEFLQIYSWYIIFLYDYARPVSYTHLDVYKRQTINYLDGTVEVIECGEEEKALDYEVIFMEEKINENKESNSIELTYDVIKIMNKVRKDWGILYPFEK